MCVPHRSLDAFQPYQESSALRQQLLPGGCESKHPWQANEQRSTQFFLKIPDSPRQRGLIDVDALSGAPEVEFFSDGNEVAQVP